MAEIIAKINSTEYHIGGESEYSNYDAIFCGTTTYNVSGAVTSDTFTVVSGTFSDCMAKLQDGKLLNFLCYEDKNNADGSMERYSFRSWGYKTDSAGSYLRIDFKHGFVNWTSSGATFDSEVLQYLSGRMTDFDNDEIQTIGEDSFYNYTGLKTVKTAAIEIQSEAFYGCSGLDYIYLTDTVGCGLEDVSALTDTSIAAGLGVIYVPDGLVDNYKSATNWSTYASQIYSINDYPVTDFSTISDSWADIIAAVNNGTYKTKYNIGDTKLLSVNGKDVYMQLVAFEKDTLANGGGTAATTWIAKGVAETHRMNATAVTTNGWAETEMRSWLRETVLPTIDSTVRSAIKEVTKTYYDYTSSSTLSIADTIWIPSYYEMGFTLAPIESSGVKYDDIFTTDASRIKYDTSTATKANWWLRTAYNNSTFRIIPSNGYTGSVSATRRNGVVVGFCI